MPTPWERPAGVQSAMPNREMPSDPDLFDYARARERVPEAPPSLGRRFALTLEMIKFKHTVFGLPFALLSALIAADGVPALPQLFWILVACIFARSAAMAFNRLHDERFDRVNPRTQNWALPAGLLSRKFVTLFCILCIAGFVISAALLNSLALKLSPIALAILLGYSATKRFTWGSHFFLGLALGIAPMGAWVAIRNEALALPPIILGAAVMLWTAGFDIIYSMQDDAVDRKLGLKSIPVRLGRHRALAVSALCHILAILGFASLEFLVPQLGTYYLIAVALCAWMLHYEHKIVSPTDLSRLGLAFFTINGWVSLAILAGGAADILFRR